MNYRPGSPLLAIDTSTAITSVSLRIGGGDISTRACVQGDSHNEELAEIVSSVLRMGSLTGAEVGGVIYGSGPGSFTGLRIGLSFIKGFLSESTQSVALVTSSLRAGAFSLRSLSDTRYCGAFADARRDEFFAVVYEIDTMKEEIPLTIIRKDEMNRINQRYSGALRWCDCTDPHTLRTPISEGLIGLFDAYPETFMSVPSTPETLAQIEPLYMREVAAKTIAERMGSAQITS